MKNSDIHVGLDHVTRKYNDGFTQGWTVTDSMRVDDVVHLEVTHWHQFPGKMEREMEEPHWNMTFSMGETSFSIAVNTREEVLKEVEKNKKAGYPPVQIDWAKYLGVEEA